MALTFSACGLFDNDVVKDLFRATTFKIEISNILDTEVDVTITPGNDSAYYYYDILEDNGEEIDDEALFNQYIAYFKGQIQKAAQNGKNYTLLDFFDQGKSSYHFKDLTPGTDYMVVVFQIHPEKETLIGYFTHKEFATNKLAKSSNVIAITVDTVNWIANVTTTNNDPYFFYCEPTSKEVKGYLYYADDFSNEELLGTVAAWGEAYKEEGFTMAALQGDCYFQGNQNIDLKQNNWLNIKDADGNYVPYYGQYIVYAAGYEYWEVTTTTAAYALFNYTAPVTEAPFAAESRRPEVVRSAKSSAPFAVYRVR